ncbi:hypothetical protein TIFTF001_055650 [Ficus carica]|uniref:Uncharacterized protein n=1 Tax=Ficus carica TaxID=3494 RepID=A0AA88EDA4_FICCA|nr:hypothetical protein TIFTF001_055650 [Ficus carica]
MCVRLCFRRLSSGVCILLYWRFLGWLNNKLSALPVWNLHISSTLTHERDRHRFEADIDIELQAPMPQVGDSDVEATGEITVL